MQALLKSERPPPAADLGLTMEAACTGLDWLGFRLPSALPLPLCVGLCAKDLLSLCYVG